MKNFNFQLAGDTGVHFYPKNEDNKYIELLLNEIKVKPPKGTIDLIPSLVNLLVVFDSKTKWVEQEWGFPKGRRNYKESNINCALREFEEETGYDKQSVSIIKNLLPFEETFVGSNLKSYKHIYFFAKCSKLSNFNILIVLQT